MQQIGDNMLKVVYVYFDLPSCPYPGWEYRTVELLWERDVSVYPIARHYCIAQGKIPASPDADIIWVANPMCLDIGVEIKKHINKPLAVQFLDIPKELFGSEQWRIEEYDRVKKLIEHADYITAISKTTAKDVEEWCGRKVDKVLYLGADEELYEIGKNKDEGYAVTVPRGLARQKNYQEAVNTTKNIIPLKVIWGQFSDVMKVKIIKGCSFGIHTSTFEGFCIPIVEFNWCGKACIVRRLPVIEEIHKRNRGVIIYDTPTELREWIIKLRENYKLRRELGERGKSFVLKNKLTLQEYTNKLKKFLESL